MAPDAKEFGTKHGLDEKAQSDLTLNQKKATVTVPASIANLGPGIDCLGVAVDIWDEITLEYAKEESLELLGETTGVPKQMALNLAVQGVRAAFKNEDRPFPTLKITCTHRIPWLQGLGAPAASFIGGFLAGSVLCGEEMATLNEGSALVRVQSEGEVSPRSRQSGLNKLQKHAAKRGWNLGNVCPAIHGGIQIGIETVRGFHSHRVPLQSALLCIIFVPENLTEGKAPEKDGKIDRQSAISNLSRMALLTNAFCTGNFDMLTKATENSLALTAASSQFPFVSAVCQAATDAGAVGAFPANYGPAVVALIAGFTGDLFAQSSFTRRQDAVANAMLAAADAAGIPGNVMIAKTSEVGAHVLAQKSDLGRGNTASRIVFHQ